MNNSENEGYFFNKPHMQTMRFKLSLLVIAFATIQLGCAAPTCYVLEVGMKCAPPLIAHLVTSLLLMLILTTNLIVYLGPSKSPIIQMEYYLLCFICLLNLSSMIYTTVYSQLSRLFLIVTLLGALKLSLLTIMLLMAKKLKCIGQHFMK